MLQFKQLIECCTTPVAPEYFLWRLHEYADAQHIPLPQAAYDILPFTQLYNCILFTTILGCILRREDLISPAMSAYIYREPLLQAIKAYPDLALQRLLPKTVLTVKHRLTKHLLDQVRPELFAHLLLAHCGIKDTDKNDDALSARLKLNTADKAYILEKCVAENGFPVDFSVDPHFNFEALPLEKLNHFLALIAVADQFDLYFSIAELDGLLRHLAKTPLQAGFAMHILASKPKYASNAYLRQRENVAIQYLCARHQWQLGFAIQQMNELNQALAKPFSSTTEVQQLMVWIVANAVLSKPITLFNAEGIHLHKALEAARSHPHLRLRYDNNGSFENALRTQKISPTTLVIEEQHLEKLIHSMLAPLSRYIRQANFSYFRGVPNKLLDNCAYLFGCSLAAVALLELIQVIWQHYVPYVIVTNANCDFIEVTSIFSLCHTCELFNQKLTVATLSAKLIDANYLVWWIKNIYDKQKDPWFHGKECGSDCLPTCEQLAANHQPLSSYYREFSGSPYDRAAIDAILSNALMFILYLVLVPVMIYKFVFPSYFLVPYQNLVDQLLEKLTLFINVTKNHFQGHTATIVANRQQLESLTLVQANSPEKVQPLVGYLMADLTYNLRIHPLTTELEQNAVAPTIDALNQSPQTSYVISQLLWQDHRQQRAEHQQDAYERMYHVV